MAEKTLIIFDVDGTLLYSNRVDSQCFAETYGLLFGRPFPSINWLEYPHVTDTTIFTTAFRDHFGREVEPQELDHFKRCFVDRLREARRQDPANFREVPGARRTLQLLSGDERFTLGVATGGFELPARFKLGHLGLPTDGFHMSFADEKMTREAILQEAIDQAGAAAGPFDRVVYVGDAIWDIRTTRNMNLNFIGIRWKGDLDFLHQAGAGVVLRDYSDFEGFLRAVSQAVPPGQPSSTQSL